MWSVWSECVELVCGVWSVWSERMELVCGVCGVSMWNECVE